MRTIHTDELDSFVYKSAAEANYIYNGLDCMMTFEIRNALLPLFERRPQCRPMYEWRLGMQAIALHMSQRGIKFDNDLRRVMHFELSKRMSKLRGIWDKLCETAVLHNVNPASPAQLKKLFYIELLLPEQKSQTKGVWKVSVNRECLEKLYSTTKDARRALVRVLLAIRDLEKDLEVLSTEPSADGRMRCSYNVAGTETGRWSSSATVFGEGMNKQNITPSLRKLFIADDGMKLVNRDQQQAESWIVALVSGDANYMEACRSGDPHTFCSRLIWPELPWNGDLAKDKKIAQQPFYRHFSYRDMAKRGGHASNYYAVPWTISRNLKIPMRSAEEFQDKYFDRFSKIRDWQKGISKILQTPYKEGGQVLRTPLGEERIFFGRPTDDATLREAIAYVPQATVGHLTNIMLARLWKAQIDILENGHDSVLFQIPDRSEDILIPTLLPLFEYPITYNGVTITIPWESKVGYTWGDLEEWKGNGSTIGQQRPKATSFLDSIVL